MHAAVVNTWGSAPAYQTYDLPAPSQSQIRVKVIAAGLHNVVRSRAAGKHYSTANTTPPHIPGSDGVGTIAETGELVYFNALSAPTGSFAEETNVEKWNVFPLPEGANADDVAVLANPAMSSWMALTARAGITPGSQFSVAIIGATGVSGQAAVQISKVMGATSVIAIGKPGAKLDRTKEAGATSIIPLSNDLSETDFSAAADVDIVLDYLWGAPSSAALSGIVSKRKDKTQRLSWVEIGAVAGDSNAVSAALLRQANVAMMGCGPGSWTFPELGKQLPVMLKAMVDNGLKAEYAEKRLEDVEAWWNETAGPRVLAKP